MALTLTNLIPTPTFESDSVGGWVASAGTLTVSTDKSAFGTRCLKLTSTAAAQTIVLTAPPSPIGNWAQPAGFAARFASTAAATFIKLGAHFLDGAGVKLGESMSSNKSINPTLARHVNTNAVAFSNISTTTVSIQPAIQWTATTSGESIYIDTATFLRHDEFKYGTHPWTTSTTMPDVIGSLAPWGNVTFAWVGTPEASYSTATSSAVVTTDSLVARGDVVTITGSGFTANANVGLRVSEDSLGEGRTRTPMVTVTADGDGAFTYDWTVAADQGSRWIVGQIAAGFLGYGAVSSEIVVQPGPAGPPSKNFIINPYLRAGNGTARYMFNVCQNPSPTVDLTGWDAIGTATVARDVAAQIVGPSHGARVVAATASDGIGLPWFSEWSSTGHTAWVRAVTACTLTIGVAGQNTTASITKAGWGNSGWGGSGYVQGATIALEAGQEIRARLHSNGGGIGKSVRMTITGSGTYDVDGVWHGIGVTDGYLDAQGSPPWFCGDTVSDDDFTYEWIGTPYASSSVRRGTVALGIASGEGNWDDDPVTGDQEYNQGHLTTLAGGETAVAFRSPQWFYSADPTITNAAGGRTLADLGLEQGKSYMFSADLIMDSSLLFSGYALDGSNGTELWVWAGDETIQPAIALPGRTRFHIPFNADNLADEIGFGLAGMPWLEGEIVTTKLALTETKIYSIGGPGAFTSPVDLTDSGIQPGSDIMVTIPADDPAADMTVAFEAEVDGVWTVINAVVIEPDDWGMTHQFTATAPANATGLRLTYTDVEGADGWIVSDAPVEYFDGSTADTGDWTYEWEGTPDASPSIRSENTGGPGIPVAAQVFLGGVALAAAEFRIAIGGQVTGISQMGT